MKKIHLLVLILDIGLIVSIQPATAEVLDATSYNSFSIVCTASLPSNVSATKQFRWTQTSLGTTINITAGVGVAITMLDLSNSTSTSVLTVNASRAGSYQYTCIASALSSQSSATSTVTVNGMHKIYI